MIYILATGSRHAAKAHRDLVLKQLVLVNQLVVCAGADTFDQVTLTHGSATGLDWLVDSIARDDLGWNVEPMPADWNGPCMPDLPPTKGGCTRTSHRVARHDGTSYCPAAGPRRNQQMVDRMTDRPNRVCAAFPAVGDFGKGGTWDCAHRAVDAGIVTVSTPLSVVRPRSSR